MTLDQLNKFLTKERLYSAARKAMSDSNLNSFSSDLRAKTESQKCRRVCLHINDDGTAAITLHESLYVAPDAARTPAPKEV